ncbi:MAG: hypothetical protein AB7K09_21795 [Planctomycetota bacterium]
MNSIDQLRDLLDHEREHAQGPGSIKHYRDEWVAALQRLSARCQEWLAPLGSRLTVTTAARHQDRVLGDIAVDMPVMMTPSGVVVKMTPMGRFPVELGRVDLHAPSGYRLLTRVAADEWVISPGRIPLDADSFGDALLELLRDVRAMVNDEDPS